VDQATGAQDRVGAGERVGGSANVAAGVVEHEVFDVDKLAGEPNA